MTVLAVIFFLVYCGVFYLAFPQPVTYGQFVVGFLLGIGLVIGDRLLHLFFLFPELPQSKVMRQVVKRKGIVAVLQMILASDFHLEKMFSRSILFYLVYIALSVFVITSTGSVLGVGTVLGMGAWMVNDVRARSQNREVFIQEFLWQLKREVTADEVQIMIYGFYAFFTLVSLLVWAGHFF